MNISHMIQAYIDLYHSMQMEFMLETILDIKNNKKKAKEDTVQHTRIKKWLQKVFGIYVYIISYIFICLIGMLSFMLTDLTIDVSPNHFTITISRCTQENPIVFCYLRISFLHMLINTK